MSLFPGNTPLSPVQAAEGSRSGNGLKLLDPPTLQNGTGSATVPSSLHDIYGPQPPVEQPPYLLYGLSGLLPLLIAAALFWWLRNRTSQPAQQVQPGTAARSDLMLARELMNEEAVLEYLEKLSEILRHYIEARFSLSPTRQTTREFLRSLAGSLPPDHLLLPYKEELRRCLETCDMAKFAHHPAALPQLLEMEQTILDFINVSDPIPADMKKRERT